MSKMLSVLGLDPLEETLYLALLEHPGQTRNDLAAVARTSRAKLVAALDSLLTRGLATVLAGKPIRYAPIAPDVAVAALAQQQINAARVAQELIPDLMDLYWRAPQDVTLDFVEIITGPAEMLPLRVRQLYAAAQDRVRAFVRPPFSWQTRKDDTNKAGEGAHPALRMEQDLLERGVAHQVIYENDQTENSGLWHRDVLDSLAAGEQARVCPALPLRLILIDDVAGLTPLVGSNGAYLGPVVIHKSPLLDALSALFESYWDRAVPLMPFASAEDSTEQLEQQLVTLLAGGLTDDAIARTLGVSRSTVLRRVKELMAQTGSQTRFQLGLQIGRRLGSISSDPACQQ